MASSTDFDASSTSYVTMGTFTGLDGATEASWSFWVNFNVVANITAFVNQYNGFNPAT